MAPILWFLLFLPLLALLLKQRKNKGDHAKKRLAPGPPKLPIIGNLHQLGPLLHRSFTELAKRHGPVMHLQLGRIPVLVVSSSEMAEEVLKNQDINFCSRAQLVAFQKFSYNYLDVGFAPYGEYWREIRKFTVMELLSAKKVQAFRFMREEEVGKMMDSIQSQIDRSDPDVNISEKILSLTNTIICRVAFGISYKSEGDHAVGSMFRNILEEAGRLMTSFYYEDYFPGIGWIIDLLSGRQRKLEETFRGLDVFYQNVIDEHLDPNRKVNRQADEDFIDVLIRLKNGKISVDELKGAQMGVLVAGTDTAAGVATWAMAELARNPSIMKKAQDEIRAVVGAGKKIVEEDDLPKLPYLELVVTEALRMHPPGPLLLPHATTRDCTIAGYHVSKDTRVFVNAWAIATNPDLWDRPDEFIPERFMDNPIDYKGQDFRLIPFGSGRRICVGMHLGLILVKLTVANLLYACNWELPAGTKEIDMKEAAGIVIHKKIELCLAGSKYIGI